MVAYIEEKNHFVSSTGAKILELTRELIQKAMIYPSSPEPQQFIETTLVFNYTTLSTVEQYIFLQMVLAPGLQSLPIVDSFPITIFT